MEPDYCEDLGRYDVYVSYDWLAIFNKPLFLGARNFFTLSYIVLFYK